MRRRHTDVGGRNGWTRTESPRTERVKPPRPALVAKAIKPDYALGPHTASLGLAYIGTPGVSPMFSRGMFVGQSTGLLVADDVGNTIWRVTGPAGDS